MEEIWRLVEFVRSKPKNETTLQDLKENYAYCGNASLEDFLNSSFFSAFFAIQKINETNWKIRTKVDVELCSYYVNNMKCDGLCGKLHLCKDFLLQQKFCEEPCIMEFSHNLSDEHNIKVLNNYDLSTKDIHVIRSSFPRACYYYLLYGKCNQLFCNSLHLEKHTTEGEVYLLQNEHNTNVLSCFQIDVKDKVSMATNILFSSKSFSNFLKGKQYSKGCSAKNMIATVLDSQTKGCETPQHQNNKPKPLVCSYYYTKNGCTKKNACSFLHVCKLFLIGSKKCLTGNGDCKHGYSHNLRDENNRKIIEKYYGESGEGEDQLRKEYPKLCRFYESPNGCTNSKCTYLHICSTFLSVGICKCDKYDHGFDSDHNVKIVEKFDPRCVESLINKPQKKKNYSAVNNQETAAVIEDADNDASEKSCETPRHQSNKPKPLVCSYYYTKSGCTKKNACSFLHVCKLFLMGSKKCLTGNDGCKYGFSHNLRDENNRKIIEKYYGESEEGGDQLRKEYPKLCHFYDTPNGCKNSKCTYLHICSTFLSVGTCKCDKYDHNFNSDHNIKIVEKFDFRCVESLINNSKKKKNCSGINNQETEAVSEDIYSDASIKRNTIENDDKKKEEIIGFILNKYPKEGGCRMDEPDLLETFFEASSEAAEKWFAEFKTVFRIHLANKTVHVCMLDVEPCRNHWNKKCIQSNCALFHVCRKLLFKAHNKNTCEFNHDFLTDDFKRKLEQNKIAGFSEEQILTILRNRYPIVCSKYQRGLCTNDFNCHELHVCEKFIFGKCKSQETQCSFLHERALEGFQAKSIADIFSLNFKRLKSYLVVRPVDASSMNDDTLESKGTFGKRQQYKWDEIMLFLLKNNPENGQCSFKDENLLSFFNDSEENVENWFRRNDWYFRISLNNGNVKTVYPTIKNVKPCIANWNRKCKGNCSSFHISREHLAEHCFSESSPTCNGMFEDVDSTKLIQRYKLQTLKSHLCILLKNRFPKVCEEYQTGDCERGEDVCENLHVCKSYVAGICKGCELSNHSNAFDSNQAVKICYSFNLKEGNLIDSLVYHFENKKITEKNLFNAFKMEAVCLENLHKKCSGKRNCPNGKWHTIKMIYLWEYQNINENNWQRYDYETNKEIEKNYCDPHIECMESTGILFDKINDDGSFSHKENNKKSRRLSTRSSVENAENDNFATEWKWYWCESPKQWFEYSNKTSSNEIEKAFLSGSVHYDFTTDKFAYRLFFNEMYQQNQSGEYFTKRNVRRRPVFKEFRRRGKEQEFEFPQTWPADCEPGHLITVSGKTRAFLEYTFRNSISTSVNIINIQEVCNHDLYEKYRLTKKQFTKKGKGNELLLYHGTDPDSAQKICRQTVDYRLCGKHGTVYGEGSYFATSASYSNGYTSGYGTNRCMFMVNVLPGKFTQGSSSYKRAPEGYDSCVNDVYNPSMYILFTLDQCYPQYLVTYQ